MNDLPLKKAVFLLAHPAVITSLALLAINDHLLRHIWPSWLTGKLGDLAWLVFAPFALAAVVSFVLMKAQSSEKVVFSLSFAIVAILFIALKLFAVVNSAATLLLSAAFKFPIVIRPDPTDLVALPGLLFAIFLWRTAPDIPPAAPRGWVALPLAALVTLANSGMPDSGIFCFSAQESAIIAQAGYSSYITRDGGTTWAPAQIGMPQACERQYANDGEWQVVPGPRENTVYRFRAGSVIQMSADSGNTWNSVKSLDAIPEAQKQYLILSRQGYVEFTPGPLDAIADLGSGSMLFAMGQQGVLIHKTDGSWTWAAVGDYQPLETFPTADVFGVLLGGIVILSAGLALLIISSLALFWVGGPVRLGFLLLAWIIWLFAVVFVPPSFSSGSYGSTISWSAIVGFFVVALPLAFEQLIKLLKRNPVVVPSLFGIGFAGGLLFLLPYILWLYSTLPTHLLATIFGLVLAASVLLVGIYFAGKRKQNNIGEIAKS